MSTPHVVRVIPTDTAPDEPAERRGTPSLVLIAAAAVAIVALTTVTAYAIGALRPDRYAAQAEILYSSDETASTSGGPRAIATQAAILRSGTVLAPVGRPAGLSTARMRDRLSVDSGEDNVLTVRLTDPDAGRALALPAAWSTATSRRWGRRARPRSASAPSSSARGSTASTGSSTVPSAGSP